jgi:hypothetical protein
LPQGLLLIEAVLSAVILTVGVVFISRGLGGQLQAIQRVEAYERLRAAARSLLTELEGRGVFGLVPLEESAGTLDTPGGAYAWRLDAADRPDVTAGEDETSLADEVIFTVAPAPSGQPLLWLATLWPPEWTRE